VSKITEVTLSDGRKVTERKAKVRDLANAEGSVKKGREHEVKYALMSAKILIDNKPAVLEDVLDMTEEDLINVSGLFDEDSPNS